MEAPRIKTAIPKRRYQVGTFSAIVLGEVESADAASYRYVLAMVEEGKSAPSLYVTAERSSPNEASNGAYRLRLMGLTGTEVLGHSDRWQDLDSFLSDAFTIAVSRLGLTDEQVVRLM